MPLPWETALPLYGRTISVTRQATPAVSTVGTVGYGGDQPVNETVILSGISAAIQYDARGRANPSNLPASSLLSYYVVLIPASEVPIGTINRNDIVIDDLGTRYQVLANHWTVLGYNLVTMTMAM
jgi:hypothetical protein